MVRPQRRVAGRVILLERWHWRYAPELVGKNTSARTPGSPIRFLEWVFKWLGASFALAKNRTCIWTVIGCSMNYMRQISGGASLACWTCVQSTFDPLTLTPAV